LALGRDLERQARSLVHRVAPAVFIAFAPGLFAQDVRLHKRLASYRLRLLSGLFEKTLALAPRGQAFSTHNQGIFSNCRDVLTHGDSRRLRFRISTIATADFWSICQM